MFKHILVPTDGSRFSLQTAERAISFAREAGAKITIFHAKSEFPISFLGEGGLIDPFTPESFAEMAEQQARAYLKEIEEKCQEAGVACDSLTQTSNSPYQAIIDAANNAGCDLIFMASHGRRGLSSLLLGSETNRVLTHTSIPVLVYRQPADSN